MQREIKFRCWSKRRKRMYKVRHLLTDGLLPLSSLHELWAKVEGWSVREDKAIELDIQPEDAIIMQWSGLNDKNGTQIYEGDLVQIRTPYRITQTHEGDNIPNGSYTEPLEPGIQTHVGEVIFLDGMFQITSYPDVVNTPSPIIWEMMSWDEEAIKNAIDTRGMIWNDPEEGDLQYLLGLAGVETLENLTHYFGIQVIGNKFQHPHLAE